MIYLLTALNAKTLSTKGKATVLKYLKLSSIFLFHHSHPHLPHTSHTPKPLHCSQLPPSYANMHPMCTLHVGISMNHLIFSALSCLVHTNNKNATLPFLQCLFQPQKPPSISFPSLLPPLCTDISSLNTAAELHLLNCQVSAPAGGRSRVLTELLSPSPAWTIRKVRGNESRL